VKIYQASTSEMFGGAKPPQNENTPFNPLSPYAEAKLRAHEDFVKGYRNKGYFVCSGILFNHESPRRGKNFVTRKITYSLAKIKLGLQDCLELGHLDTKRDWGFAGDYVEAMWLMLQQDRPEDFIIGTGQSHSVREFAEIAATELGIKLHWEGEGINEVGKDENGKVIVKVNEKFYRPTDPFYLLADPSKAIKVLGWKPRVDFRALIKMMVTEDLKALKS
jgi:GDPmannose 4,6-dehydratase